MSLCYDFALPLKQGHIHECVKSVWYQPRTTSSFTQYRTTKLGSSSVSALARSLLISTLGESSPHQSEAMQDDKKRLELRLPESDYLHLQKLAETFGMTSSKLLTFALRSYITKHPLITSSELNALYQSNYQLLRIGRNLNQIARQLNAMESVNFSSRHVESLLKFIDEHTAQVGAMIRENRDRFDF